MIWFLIMVKHRLLRLWKGDLGFRVHWFPKGGHRAVRRQAAGKVSGEQRQKDPTRNGSGEVGWWRLLSEECGAIGKDDQS